MMLSIFALSAIVTIGIQGIGFLVAYALQTEKFYDILGGINFITLGVLSFTLNYDEHDPIVNNEHGISKGLVATILFFISRSWLLIFLAWRAHSRNGDTRFDGVKEHFGTFGLYWTVQGIWVFTVSLPILFINSHHHPQVSSKMDTPADFIFAVMFGVALICEIVADISKAKWVQAGRNGGFCNVSIWKFSRHPNYFGEIFQWWAAFGLAFSQWNDIKWWSTILSPLVTVNILLNTPGTGIMQANGKNLKRYYDHFPEEYAKYRKETSILIPMIGYQYVPMFLKRTIFLDFERYEYPDRNKKQS